MYFRMASITQDMRYRLSLIKYAEKYGVSKAAIKYKTNRQYIYRWKNRYDGSWDFLRNRSRRPIPILTSILLKRSNSSVTCDAEIPMRGWLSFGSSSCGKGINALFPGFTASLKNRESWLKSFPIPNMSQNLMKKWTIRDNGFRLT